MPILVLHTGNYVDFEIISGVMEYTEETKHVKRGIEDKDLSFIAEDLVEADYVIHTMHPPGTTWKYKDAETNKTLSWKRRDELRGSRNDSSNRGV